MAYEILLGKGYTFSVDYWSLGICLYEFSCDSFPFNTEALEDPLEIYHNIIESSLTFPKFIRDNNLKDIISKLLEKNPSSRITSTTNLFSHPWFEDFELDKLKEMSLHVPYLPKLKANIRLKMIGLEEYLDKNKQIYEIVPLDEEKINCEEEIWLENF
jgi:serine/threonine protein kinase